MATTVTSASMSLDGFVADLDDAPGPIFDWYDAGPVTVPTAVEGFDFHLTPQSAAYWTAWTSGVRCLVVGRRLFDLTGGWDGRHPIGGVPVVVVSHSVPDGWPRDDAPFEFVTSVEEGVARGRDIAGDGVVGIAAGQIGRQAIDLGLVDAVAIDLVPVVMGAGIPYFGPLTHGPVVFGDPEITPAPGVTHLVFRRRD